MQAAVALADFRAFFKFLEIDCCVTSARPQAWQGVSNAKKQKT